jgi:hypothetical protein
MGHVADHPHHFLMLAAVERDNMRFERALNLAQVVSFEYAENGPNDTPLIALVLSGGGKADYRGDDARHIYRMLKGRY